MILVYGFSSSELDSELDSEESDSDEDEELSLSDSALRFCVVDLVCAAILY